MKRRSSRQVGWLKFHSQLTFYVLIKSLVKNVVTVQNWSKTQRTKFSKATLVSTCNHKTMCPLALSDVTLMGLWQLLHQGLRMYNCTKKPCFKCSHCFSWKLPVSREEGWLVVVVYNRAIEVKNKQLFEYFYSACLSIQQKYQKIKILKRA